MTDRRWYERPPPGPPARPVEGPASQKKDLWVRCPDCSGILYRPDLPETAWCCPECGHHLRIAPMDRIRLLVDEGSWEPVPDNLEPLDPLGFVDSKPYTVRLRQAQARTGRRDAFLAGHARIGGIPVEVGSFDFAFMGGSMGSVVGEHITRLFERALERRCPAVVISASGGARMQEGALSLMQMARTCAALGRLRDEGGMPYVSILTLPTTGGVAASFAMLGDVILAEPGALIGFAGPRVIQQTIGQELPEGFQTSEYLLEHGLVDRITPRAELREVVSRVLAWAVADGR